MGAGATAGDPKNAKKLKPEDTCVNYEGWLKLYEMVKNGAKFPAMIESLKEFPGAVNNRKAGGLNTILHQAAYWEVEEEILLQLKDLGADPNLRNVKGHTPVDLVRDEKPSKADAVAARFTKIFSEDDEVNRGRLLEAAKCGDFLSVFEHLSQSPHLINTQSIRGWAVIHQAAFHGAGELLIKRLVAMKASLWIKTDTGWTAQQIYTYKYPDLPPIFDNITMPSGEVLAGMDVVIYPKAASGGIPIRGKVDEVDDDGHVTVTEQGGSATHHVPKWRVIQAVEKDNIDLADVLGGSCQMCFSPVLTHPFPGCKGNHPFCGECTMNFLWSQFTTLQVPIKCVICKERVKLAEIPDQRGRTLSAVWPPGKSRGIPETEMEFSDFIESVQQKEREKENTDGDEYKLAILKNCPPTAAPIAYSNVRGCPSIRACPQCGILIEYGSACKHFSCLSCKLKFCFICLRTETHHNTDNHKWHHAHPCPIADRQTNIPKLGA